MTTKIECLFTGRTYALYWTAHAQKRVAERGLEGEIDVVLQSTEGRAVAVRAAEEALREKHLVQARIVAGEHGVTLVLGEGWNPNEVTVVTVMGRPSHDQKLHGAIQQTGWGRRE